MWLLCTAAVAVSLLPLSSRVADQLPTLLEYHRIVQEYRRGRDEAAVRELLALNDQSVLRAVEELSHSMESGDLALPWLLVDVQAAVVFHTELAIRGIQDSTLQRGRQLEIARRLAEVRSRRAGGGDEEPVLGRDFLRRWHLVMAWQAHGILDLDGVTEEVEALRRGYRVDAEILLTAGSLSETLAWPALDDSLPRPMASPRTRQSRTSLLKDAEAQYRRAIALAPELDEARLRLGRVLHDQGRYEDALSTLTPMLTASHDTWILYLGRLFAGAACERLSRFADAASHYRAAGELRPQAQTGVLALSFVQRQMGDAVTARKTLSLVTAAVRGDGQDPWWEYQFGQWRHVSDALFAMRREVAR